MKRFIVTDADGNSYETDSREQADRVRAMVAAEKPRSRRDPLRDPSCLILITVGLVLLFVMAVTAGLI